jgi:hypothetical protein
MTASHQSKGSSKNSAAACRCDTQPAGAAWWLHAAAQFQLAAIPIECERFFKFPGLLRDHEAVLRLCNHLSVSVLASNRSCSETCMRVLYGCNPLHKSFWSALGGWKLDVDGPLVVSFSAVSLLGCRNCDAHRPRRRASSIVPGVRCGDRRAYLEPWTQRLVEMDRFLRREALPRLTKLFRRGFNGMAAFAISLQRHDTRIVRRHDAIMKHGIFWGGGGHANRTLVRRFL